MVYGCKCLWDVFFVSQLGVCFLVGRLRFCLGGCMRIWQELASSAMSEFVAEQPAQVAALAIKAYLESPSDPLKMGT